MSRLVWDQIGEKYFEGGIEKVALFLLKQKQYQAGVAWSGVSKIEEGNDGGDEKELLADDIKYAGIRGSSTFKPTIEAYTYPDEFAECDGCKSPAPGVFVGQQRRCPFGLAYVSKIGNDEEGFDLAYKLHLAYGCTASPSSKSHETINPSDPDATTFSWECSSTPEKVDIAGYRPTAHLEFDSRTVDAEKLAVLENFVFGSDGSGGLTPNLPTADSVVKFMRGDQGAELIHYVPTI